MRGVLVEVPEQMLAERRRLGLDGRDEMWEGVLHMVPPAGGRHQRLGSSLLMTLGPVAERWGLVVSYETGLFRNGDDYRVPDLLFYRPEHASDRGAEGADLVVELRSPGDESYAKLDFYAALGVREVLVVDPAGPAVELFRLVGERLLPVSADTEGGVRSDVLAVRFHTSGDALRLTWVGGEAAL
ncbi:Uma2 family endonuclease [Geodermatophilus sp. DF01-2]|uniref:Uma2 family endonuclease n=1 Tax=Geodermatophilus sp. DF01-2 TaxID=2559610 RepID=UPI00143208EA|nr:Uma2 family endonuclease [Geodermatophilus sp. DF01_2]